MAMLEFNLTETDSLEIRISDNPSLFDLCDLFYINKANNQEFIVSDSTLIDFLNSFQDVADELHEGTPTIFSPLFEKGAGYYYLLDCLLIHNGNKRPCSWTEYLEALALSVHHKFLWLYRFQGKFYFELTQNFDSFIENEEIIMKEYGFSDTIIIRKEVSYAALVKISTHCAEIRSRLDKKKQL